MLIIYTGHSFLIGYSDLPVPHRLSRVTPVLCFPALLWPYALILAANPRVHISGLWSWVWIFDPFFEQMELVFPWVAKIVTAVFHRYGSWIFRHLFFSFCILWSCLSFRFLLQFLILDACFWFFWLSWRCPLLMALIWWSAPLTFRVLTDVEMCVCIVVTVWWFLIPYKKVCFWFQNFDLACLILGSHHLHSNWGLGRWRNIQNAGLLPRVSFTHAFALGAASLTIYSSCSTAPLDFSVTHSCQLLYKSSQSVHYDLKGSCLGAPDSLIPVKGVTAWVTACGSGPGYISDYLRQWIFGTWNFRIYQDGPH